MATSDLPEHLQTPAGDAHVPALASPDELVAATIAAARATFENAPDDAARRWTALARRLAATGDDGPPLARALRRWRLDDVAARLALLAIAGELSPQVLALAMTAAGDGARPGITVEAAARAFGGDTRGVATIARALAPTRPAGELAIVALRGAELPLVRRTLAVTPRAIDIALGATAADPTTSAWLVAVPSGSAPLGDAHARARAVLVAPTGTVVGVARGDRATLSALAHVAASEGRALVAAELSLLAEDWRARAIARDAAFLGAALALVVDVGARELARASRLVDRVAAHVPVFVLVGAGEPAPSIVAGAIEIELPPPDAATRRAAVAGAFADLLDAAEVDAVAATAPADLGALPRAAAALRADEMPLSRATAARRAIAAQLAPAGGGGIERIGGPLPPVPAALAPALDDLAARWASMAAPRRLRLLVSGRPGVGKTTIVGQLAARLGVPAFVVDVPRLARGDGNPALATVLAAVAAGTALLAVENVELVAARRPGRAEGPVLPWPSRPAGAVAMTTRDNVTALDAALRREFDRAIVLAFPDDAERRAAWRWQLARRGIALAEPQLAALAGHAIGFAHIERIVSLARDGDDVVAELERRALFVAGRAGVEFE